MTIATASSTEATGNAHTAGTDRKPGLPPGPPTATGGRRLALIGLTVVGGMATALSSRVGGSLARYTGEPIVAAMLALAVAWVVFGALMAASPTARAALRRLPRAVTSGGLKWWHMLGGVAGALFAISQAFTVGPLGVAVFIVALVAGQSLGSVLIDALGLAPGGKRPITLVRLIGPALTIAAAALGVGGTADVPYLYALLPFLAGIGLSWNQAVNGRVRMTALAVNGAGPHGPAPSPKPAPHAATVATLSLNFFVSGLTLIVAFALIVAFSGMPSPELPANPGLYLATMLAAVGIYIGASVVRHLGVLVLTLAMIAGKTTGSLVIDTVTGYTPDLTTIAATVLALAACAIPVVMSRKS